MKREDATVKERATGKGSARPKGATRHNIEIGSPLSDTNKDSDAQHRCEIVVNGTGCLESIGTILDKYVY